MKMKILSLLSQKPAIMNKFSRILENLENKKIDLKS